MPISEKSDQAKGLEMYQWASDLFPIHRSLTGPGVRKSIMYLKNLLPNLHQHSVPSGTNVFDWKVPQEWSVKDAYIENEKGEKVVDTKNNNLHLLGYSTPVDKWVTKEELDKHLYSLPHLPNAIPYVTSYYKKKWGFCIQDSIRKTLPDGYYHVVVKSDFKEGVLNYADLIIPGDSEKEIFFSTYICHPSMANNELSGPVLAVALAQSLLEKPTRKFSYRFTFVPETIGAITYLDKHIATLKENVFAGFVLTCVGDNDNWSFLPSRKGNTVADRVTRSVLNDDNDINYREYSFLSRGSDERQYCAPGVDLPVVSVMRSKYEEYPEYHTSLDDLDFISPEGLQSSYDIYQKVIEKLENSFYPKVTVLCEPQLGKRNLYPDSNVQGINSYTRNMRNILAFADGTLNTNELLQKTEVNPKVGLQIINRLKEHGLIVDYAYFTEHDSAL